MSHKRPHDDDEDDLWDYADKPPRFNGSDYDPAFDDARLSGQIERVFNVMKDGKWRTLSEIEAITGDPHASISAQLRHLRKKRFGWHIVDKRCRGDRIGGLFEYRLTVNKEGMVAPVIDT